MEVLLDTCGRRTVKVLLLLHLFFAKATADCPKPQPRGDVVLTDNALLMNTFPKGVDVILECANGFVKDSGSGFITCVDDNWTEPDLTCKKKDCGLPPIHPNMSFNTSAGTLFGAVIKVICDKGFQVSGSSFKQCYAIGWIGKAKCEIVTCEIPEKLTKGKSSWDSQDEPMNGDIIEYVCEDGYALIGKNNTKCSETGEYDSPPPTCEGVTAKAITTTEMVTPTPAAQDSSATPTALRDKTVRASTTAAVGGGREHSTAEGKATTTVTSMTSSSFQDKPGEDVDTNQDVGHMPVIISVISVSLAVCIMALFLHKFLLKRKGSYDTREDLKPELLQFQSL
ncbi:complement decay-accelerating factor isoform X1 [Pseudochaenichthys georgianus]|uniref:complement decay-accelerating factor isoform X1 n=1 Tax=Pseudochaenichthys georgianus TaxID=52239 RepID=UPI001469BE63|nr:complement decay-accelerating factor isoform X1 [Pseudochaenichthys georgianus]